jgi:Recombination endonuclease VII
MRNPDCRKAAIQAKNDGNRSRSREYQRALPYEVRQANNLRTSHGITPAGKQAMLDTQGGCCYLCGEPITYDEAVIDHDHRCCSDVTRTGRRRTTSCEYCRRGLACGRCNTLIGMAGDDPERLIRIVRNLAAAQSAATERVAGKPQQLTLEIPEAA